MSEQNLELEAFSKFIVALEPWLEEAVLIGGWVATGRTLRPERLAETAQAGLKEIFGKEKTE